jgi:hypothetical protein
MTQLDKYRGGFRHLKVNVLVSVLAKTRHIDGPGGGSAATATHKQLFLSEQRNLRTRTVIKRKRIEGDVLKKRWI